MLPGGDDTPRVVVPSQLIGAKTAAELLGIDRSNLFRRIEAGKIKPLAQLDGPGGVYVFDRADIIAARTSTGEPKNESHT